MTSLLPFLTSLSIGGLVGTLQLDFSQMARMFFVEKVSVLENYKQLKQPAREFWQRVSESLITFSFLCAYLIQDVFANILQRVMKTLWG